MKALHTVTALIELGAGLALLCFPSATVTFLVGAPLETSAALTVARVGGAGLLALSVACWLARGDTQSKAARGLVAASEHNDGHEDRFCRNGNYNPDEIRPPTGGESWQRWQFVYTGNARVPKEIIWGHGGLWSDNSVAMLAALFRIHFPLTAGGMVAPPEPRLAPRAPDLRQLNQDKPR